MKKNCMILYIGIVSSIDKAPCQSQANKEDKALGNFFCVKGNTWCIDTKTTMIGVYRLNERDAVLLDSGSAFQPDESEFILNTLDAEGLGVKAVIATHGHWDHIGNNRALREKYGCQIYMYGSEAYTSKNIDNLRFMWSRMAFQEMRPLLARMEALPTDYIPEGETELEICGRKFGILHTPGHSRSHIAILTEDNVAMIGDAIMTEQVLRHSKLPYAENIAVDFRTKRKLAALRCDRYILSHKGVLDDLREIAEQNISHYIKRAEAVASCVQDGMSFDDIAAAVIMDMHIHIRTRFDFSDICVMITPFVQYLEEIGRIEAWYENGYLRYRRKR